MTQSSNSIVALSKVCADAIEDCGDFRRTLSTIFWPKVYRTFALDAGDKNMLVCAYRIMYPNVSIVIKDVATVCMFVKSLKVSMSLVNFSVVKRKNRIISLLCGEIAYDQEKLFILLKMLSKYEATTLNMS